MARFGQPRAFLLSHCLATLGLSAVSTTEGLPLCRSHTVRRVLTEDESRPRQPRTLTAIALEEWEWRVLIRFAGPVCVAGGLPDPGRGTPSESAQFAIDLRLAS